MKSLKENIVIKFLCLVMAFHLITCSIYLYGTLIEEITTTTTFYDAEDFTKIELDDTSNTFDAVFEHDEQDKNEELEEETNLLSLTPLLLENKNAACKFNTDINANYLRRYINTFHPDLIPYPPQLTIFS